METSSQIGTSVIFSDSNSFVLMVDPNVNDRITILPCQLNLPVVRIDYENQYVLIDGKIYKFHNPGRNFDGKIETSYLLGESVIPFPVKDFQLIGVPDVDIFSFEFEIFGQKLSSIFPEVVNENRGVVQLFHLLIRDFNNVLWQTYFVEYYSSDDEENISTFMKPLTNTMVQVRYFRPINYVQVVRQLRVSGFAVVTEGDQLLLYAERFKSEEEDLSEFYNIPLKWCSPIPDLAVRELVKISCDFSHLSFIARNGQLYRLTNLLLVPDEDRFQQLPPGGLFSHLYRHSIEDKIILGAISSYERTSLYLLDTKTQLFGNGLRDNQFRFPELGSRLCVDLIDTTYGFLLEDDQGYLWHTDPRQMDHLMLVGDGTQKFSLTAPYCCNGQRTKSSRKRV